MQVIEKILELARWAPSGDNTQPWRFEIAGAEHLVLHGFDTREHCVYDFAGHPSQISLGALIETIVIAASEYHLTASVQRRIEMPETNPTFDVHFHSDAKVLPNPLIQSIRTRCVQRRPFSTRPLEPGQKSVLLDAVGSGYKVLWLEGFANRTRVARLISANSKIRLTMPEAYQVHRDIIQWDSTFSEDRIPDQALGLDPLTTKLMKWAMQSWKRVDFLNKYMAGTLAPRIQLDVIPALACAAHFVLLAPKEARDIDDFVAAGRALQRFWLTATDLRLQLQPEYTPLVFASYVRAGIRFSQTPAMWDQAENVTTRLAELLGEENVRRAVFMGRIGSGPVAKARSTRLPLDKLRV